MIALETPKNSAYIYKLIKKRYLVTLYVEFNDGLKENIEQYPTPADQDLINTG